MGCVGVCAWCVPVMGPFALHFAKSASYEGIQLTDLRGPYWGYPLNNEVIQEGYLKASKETGVIMESIHIMSWSHSTGPYEPVDSPKGRLAMKTIDQAIEAALKLNIPVINVSAQPATQEATDNMVSHLNRIVKKASDYGLRVAYEPGQPYDKLVQIVERVQGLRLNYHLSDASGRMGYQIPLYLFDLIEHVHLTDHRIEPDTGKRWNAIVGQGNNDYVKEGIQILKEKGYDGWYHSEGGFVDFTLPEDVARGNYGRGYPELTAESVLPPATFGIGEDLLYVMKKNAEAIRVLLS